jgi:hypothetical protein
MSIFSSAAMRALAPHLLDLAKGVLPLFTSTRADQQETPAEHEDMQGLQIRELQQAATAQAGAVRELAERTEVALAELEERLKRQQRISMIAMIIAGVATVLALWALLR